MKAILFSSLVLWCAGTFAQEVTFRGRIVHMETGECLKGVKVSAPGASEAITDDEGFFVMTLPAGTREVQIEMPSGWAVEYPRQGKTPVPRSSEASIEFLVKQLQSENAALKAEVKRLTREGKVKEEQIDSLRAIIQDTIQAFERRLAEQLGSVSDSMELVAAQKAAFERQVKELTAKLEAGYLKRNKEEVYEGLSRELNVYLDKLKDLRDLLKPSFMRTVTLSPESLKELGEKIEAYNLARTALYEAHENRLHQVDLYWEREMLTYQLREVYDLALQRIHQEIILPLNDGPIEAVRDAALGQGPRMTAQSRATKAAREALNALEIPIQELEEKIESVHVVLRS